MPDRPFLNRLDSDVIVSGAAIFISLCTLTVLLYEASIMREQQRAAVWPYVEVGPSFRPDAFAFRTANQGVGPARIQSMEVRVDGMTVRTWGTMLTALGVADTSVANDKTNGRVLPAQSSIRSVYIDGAEQAELIYGALFDGGDPRIVIELCYCSVYDECWHLRVQGLDNERTPVGACERDEEREFLY